VDVCDNGQCVQIPCHERGVHIACARSGVCCGFPLDGSYPCPQDVSEGECYVAPRDTWCKPCGSDGDACEVPGYGHGEPGVCLTDEKDSNTYCHLNCRTSDDCPATWQCKYTYIQACRQASDCEPTATCEMAYKGYDDQGQVQEVDACHCQTDADCPADVRGFRAVCEDFRICDETQEPMECHDGKVCKYAKACQCSSCCADLWEQG
jgi:hypothetical protein